MSEPSTPLSGWEDMPGGGTHALSPEGKALAILRLSATVAVPVGGHGPEIELAGGLIRPQFSPDGRFVSHELAEAGRLEVFVQPFPPNGTRQQVSRLGGRNARWHPNGRELYYLAPDDALMAVGVSTSPSLSIGEPAPLFKANLAETLFTGVRFNYAVAPDGRFLIVEAEPGSPSPSLRVVFNWRAMLEP